MSGGKLQGGTVQGAYVHALVFRGPKLTHADPFWSHFSTFGLGNVALKKRPLFHRSGPVVNRQN